MLPDIRKRDLYAVWRALIEADLATANRGLITDIIACPGLDYCALATRRARSRSPRAISRRFADEKRQATSGRWRSRSRAASTPAATQPCRPYRHPGPGEGRRGVSTRSRWAATPPRPRRWGERAGPGPGRRRRSRRRSSGPGRSLHGRSAGRTKPSCTPKPPARPCRVQGRRSMPIIGRQRLPCERLAALEFRDRGGRRSRSGDPAARPCAGRRGDLGRRLRRICGVDLPNDPDAAVLAPVLGPRLSADRRRVSRLRPTAAASPGTAASADGLCEDPARVRAPDRRPVAFARAAGFDEVEIDEALAAASRRPNGTGRRGR